MPKISIVMPVFNGEEYIKEAIDSIINQTFTDWEFLIINEFGSNEAVTSILYEYEKHDRRIKIIQNTTRLRIAASMNVGLDMAQGEYIARMDADDISTPERLARQVQYMDNHPEIGLLGIKPTIFGEEDWEWNAEIVPEQVKTDSLFYLPCLHPTVMMRKSVLDEYKLRYNDEFYCTEDYDLFEKILQYTKASNLLDKGLFKYRRYASAATYQHGNKGDEIYKIVMSRAFNRLGLEFLEDDLSLLYIHESLNGKSGIEVEKGLVRLDLLLKKIFFANEKKKVYDKKHLFRTLHKRYEEAYETLSWKCKKYDMDKAEMWYKKSIFSYDDFYKQHNMNVSNPIVSVIMPTFNSEDYIVDTIWSVLNQTLTNFEFLILNEFGSNDDTVLIANLFNDSRIKIIQNKQKLGLAETLNYGFKIARGKYLARVDSDDTYSSLRFEKQVDFLEKNQGYGICGTWQHHFGINIDSNHCPSIDNDDLKAEFIYNCEFCHSTVMLKKDVLINNGLYYDNTKQAEDYDLWTRAIAVTKFTNIPEVLGQYRIGDNNITAKKLDLLQKESGEIAASIIKRDFDIDIPKEHIKYMGGWKNEFAFNDDITLRKNLVKREKMILKEMLERNKVTKKYNQISLEKVVKRRLEWIEQNKPVNAIKIAKRNNMGFKTFVKKILKRTLKPCVKIRNLVFRPIQRQMWDINGHISDLDGHMWDYYEKLSSIIVFQQEKIDHLEKGMNELKAYIGTYEDKNHNALGEILHEAEETKKCINKSNQKITQDIKILEANIIQNMDTYISKAEEGIIQKTDTRIWEAEKNINQITDTRIWKAEENTINTVFDETRKVRSEIWNLSYKINRDSESLEEGLNVNYNSMFYDDNRFGSYLSAYYVLREILPQINPKSICDFGCGTGTWLHVAKKMGVREILGYDGEYVDKKWLMIDENNFIPADLSKTLKVTHKFDMAMSLEVAEHIDEKYADVFIDNLCNVSDVVLFSAAHPGQGGDGHINEQPMKYWSSKFEKRGYKEFQIKDKFKYNRDICSWYRDNIVLFVK